MASHCHTYPKYFCQKIFPLEIALANSLYGISMSRFIRRTYLRCNGETGPAHQSGSSYSCCLIMDSGCITKNQQPEFNVQTPHSVPSSSSYQASHYNHHINGQGMAEGGGVEQGNRSGPPIPIGPTLVHIGTIGSLAGCIPQASNTRQY
jgi:hypothetical protein